MRKVGTMIILPIGAALILGAFMFFHGVMEKSLGLGSGFADLEKLIKKNGVSSSCKHLAKFILNHDYVLNTGWGRGLATEKLTKIVFDTKSNYSCGSEVVKSIFDHPEYRDNLTDVLSISWEQKGGQYQDLVLSSLPDGYLLSESDSLSLLDCYRSKKCTIEETLETLLLYGTGLVSYDYLVPDARALSRNVEKGNTKAKLGAEFLKKFYGE